MEKINWNEIFQSGTIYWILLLVISLVAVGAILTFHSWFAIANQALTPLLG